MEAYRHDALLDEQIYESIRAILKLLVIVESNLSHPVTWLQRS
jgi:hypothetical protein